MYPSQGSLPDQAEPPPSLVSNSHNGWKGISVLSIHTVLNVLGILGCVGLIIMFANICVCVYKYVESRTDIPVSMEALGHDEGRGDFSQGDLEKIEMSAGG